MRELLRASATELARLVRAGEVSSREVVDLHISEVERLNPTLNAIVAERFIEARTEADKADTARATTPANELPPLHGVPCTVKESFALEGMPNTGGLVARKSIVAERDATAVKRVRQAGAIPLGMTNVSELCMWMESYNEVYGRTNNAYDVSRIAGGSSGGEGAIIGAGASPFGIGADVGGSIRLPAFFNGVFGHKPTGGRIPNTGQYPISDRDALRFLCTGPLARRAEDLPLLVRLLWGPDGNDPECTPAPLRDPRQVDVSKLEVISVDSDGRIPIQGDLRDAHHQAAMHLRSLGANVREVRFSTLRNAMEIWAAMIHEAQETPYAQLLGNGKLVRPGPELLRWVFGRSQHTFPSIGLCVLELVADAMPKRRKQMLAMGRRLREELTKEIGDNGVMLYPTYPTPAPRHDRPLMWPFYWPYTAIMNVMEVPVTQVPLGLNTEGLPLGLQVVGNHDNDHLCMAVGLELERAFGGWQPVSEQDAAAPQSSRQASSPQH